LSDKKTQQPIVANGLAFDVNGILYISDTARGAIWKTTIGADGSVGKPTLLAQSSLLEGADGLDFDRSGRLWVTANERNAILTLASDGKVQEIAKNGSQGPLEFPSAIVFVGGRGYISNFDTPRRDNMDANGTTARDGIGAQCFCHLETVVHHIVFEGVYAVVLDYLKSGHGSLYGPLRHPIHQKSDHFATHVVACGTRWSPSVSSKRRRPLR
jgi:hypothetical protein